MKTRKEINEKVINIDNEINNHIEKIGFFDSDFVELFKKWQTKENKYLDLDISKVKFEVKRILSDNPEEVICKKRMGFTPKRVKNGDINWFTIKDLTNIKDLCINEPDTIEKTTMDLIKQKVDKNNTGKSEKLIPIKKGDILVSFKLTVGIVKIYNSNKIAYCNEAIDILTVKKGIYNKYVAYNCMIEYPKYSRNTNNGQTLNDEEKKKIKIYIPKPIKTEKKEYSSYDVQKIIIEFLEYQLNISKQYREQLQNIEKDIEEFEKGLLPAIFSKNNDYIKQMFIKWNTNPSVPRKKEEMVDFTLDDVEFEEKSLFNIIELKNGTEFPKGYVKKKENQGNIPLISAGVKNDIMGYIKSLLGNKSDEPDKHYVFNSTKNKWNEIILYKGKDYYTLTADGIGGELILRKKEDYSNGFYTTNVCKVVIFKDKNIYDKYFYYAYQIDKQKVKFDFLIKANNKNLSKIKIKIPKPIKTKTKEYSFYNVQKAIVTFIDRFYEWQEQVKLKIEKLNKLLDKIDEAILYKAFKD